MPELPEVQTIIDDLNKKIKGDTITDFWSDWPKAIKGKTLKEFTKEIKGRKILGARRIGKNIFIDLSGGKTLYIHLKMTGHLLVKSEKLKVKSYFDDKVNSYIHHIWYLGKNKTIEFSDVRKFAKIVLDDTEKINNLPEIKKLGVDAMSESFTLKKFEEILERRKNKSIGLVLMEQELISGIGNIYRSEILFEAGVLPTRHIRNLNNKEIERIYQAIKKVLARAIKLRGTSDSDYRDTAGAPGKFQKALCVYRQAGKPCKKCDTIVRRSTLGQRSIFFCSKCQK
ncbi:MAG: bifunctional DNA-formamidopyrimidine glycosylase/DNA-(apurinic or apyrimidinic site) lyase [Parcubacteria group bacterium]|jgi:formamidopyrimidine-DNA glycosylase